MRLYVVLFCVILATPYAYQSSTPSGCVELDENSFSKITGKFKVSLVKFDVAYPYGDKHDAYVAVAKDAKDINDLLVAEVGVKDYGEKDNEELAMKYGATKDNFPVVKLFIQGKEPITFDDKNGFNTNQLRRFIRENTGIYLSLPGCIRELDTLAMKFMESKKPERKDILKEVEDFVKTLQSTEKSSGRVYKTIMEKILDKGDEFISTELERVKKLLGERINNVKKIELENRVNILQSFRLFDKKPKTEL